MLLHVEVYFSRKLFIYQNNNVLNDAKLFIFKINCLSSFLIKTYTSQLDKQFQKVKTQLNRNFLDFRKC